MCFTDFESPEFVNGKIVQAVKPHRCCECGRTINTGELYEYVSGQWCGDFQVFKTCGSCYATRQDVIDREIAEGCSDAESVPPFGGLHECLSEYDPPIEVRPLAYGIALLEAVRKGCAK